jgi:ubiquinone biosynthesis protein
MRRLRLALRLLAIQRTLLRHGLDELVWRIHLFRPLAGIQRLIPGRQRANGTLGERARRALEELGPLFVKFGQAVSVRRDLLPAELADELAKLQDRVAPFPSAIAKATLEQAFRAPLDEVFPRFDPEPLAAASIAQVHAAQLRTGADVVVKILRPNVAKIIRRDVDVLFAFARLAERYWPEARRLHPTEVVAEFQKTLSHELNLLREGASAAQLKRNFGDSEKLYVPEVHWDYCRSNVLTLERIYGIPISDVARVRQSGVDIRQLAENGVDIFFTQVFRHNFFHADMHPGNIFVDATEPRRPRYVAVDFGIVGSLSETDQQYLAENFLAFFRRDYRRVARLHVDSGWVPPDTRVDELEAAIRAVCEPIFNKPLKEISFGVVLLRLFETAREFHMEVQPQLVLLQKTLLAIEGLGRQLYPDLDLWRTAQPILEQWVRQRRDPREQLKRIVAALPQLADDLASAPELLNRFVREARQGGGRPAATGPEPFAASARRRHDAALATGAALLMAGVLWTGLAEPRWLGWLGAASGLVILLVAWQRTASERR